MNLLTKSIILAGIVGLVGCSTNTQTENTVIGGTTGAVVGGLAGSLVGAGTGQVVAIGVGAIAGALIGGTIGHNMDSTDTTHCYQAMNQPTQHATKWVNPKTGITYSIVPTSPRMTYHGNTDCRQYRASVMMNGKMHRRHGVACMQADGTWKAMN